MAHDSLYAAPPSVGAEADAGRGPGGLATLRGLLGSWDAAVVAALAVAVLLAGLTVENFATGRNTQFLLLDLVPLALIALPMTLIVITGEIDLSVASMVGLCSTLMGQLWLSSGLSLELICVLVVLLGGVLGALNGLFVTGFGLPSLAVTIGTLALYRGLSFVVLGDQAVADFPASWTAAAMRNIPGTSVPAVVVPVLLLALVFGVVLHATSAGRALYATGNNDQAATFAGVSVARTKFWLFVVSGAVCGLVGVFWTLRYASARGDNATGLELTVVTAVLLGGVSIFGGRGGLLGVVAGVLLLGVLRNALQLADVDANALTIVTGTLLIASVVLPNAVADVRARLHRRRQRANPVAP
ncbi:ABC transporter permease [Micromonospora sp. WMMD812]|uniref:ABC transporter permease n=1 Tax=Micromonospora sp. WMMD812 TaxID=3015152 RepID=UPI00248B2C7C|nr:ABC transporter permease [Micromonospora sp. WMMD812]WBB67918.1 ABC transporter permease [Micromonospora sp. WMMD812]